MARNIRTIKEKEAQLKIEIDVTKQQITLSVEAAPERQLSMVLKKFREQLNDMQALAYERLAITSAQEKQAETEAWVQYYTPLENFYAASWCKYEDRFSNADAEAAAKVEANKKLYTSKKMP